MAKLVDIVQYTNELLNISVFKDYCPNGLQIEGKYEVKKIISGVTASQALIDAAVDAKTDLILVHHGYFWKGEPEAIVGMKAKRISAIMKHNLSLLAYHLPLDAHPTLGNNFQLSQRFNFSNPQAVDVDGVPNLFWYTELPAEQALDELVTTVKTQLQREPLVEQVNTRIKKIGWCTGGAQDYINKAIELGCDTFITGEVSERTIHIARENQINFISAGHHATERYGVQALGEHLAKQFDLEHQYVEIDNPV